jgi:hypothetical protein
MPNPALAIGALGMMAATAFPAWAAWPTRGGQSVVLLIACAVALAVFVVAMTGGFGP